jgi:HlyD family secretion protein
MRLIPASDLDAAEMTALQAEAAVRSARAQIVQANAALDQSKVNLAHTRIITPIDGIVISRNVDVGQTVAASMQAPTLFVIAKDLTQMRVNASISESDIGKIHAGQRVSFRVDAYPDEIFSGQVSQVRLNPLVEQNVVSYVTVIDVPNVELKLKPGMTATVTVEVARSTDVLRVPNAALRIRPSAEVFTALQQPRPASATGGGTRPSEPRSAGRTVGTKATRATDAQLWMLVEGRLEAVPVRVGITDGTRTAVLGGGLEDGAQVVTTIELPKAATSTSTSPLLPSRGRGAGGAGSSTRPTTTGRN